MKPLRAELKLRNNRLIRLREELGFTSAPKFCKAMGISYTTYVEYENMRGKSPLLQSGEWSVVALQVAEMHGVSCEYLWPEALRQIKKNKVVTEVDEAQLARLAEPPPRPLLPSEIFETEEMESSIRQAMEAHLTEREAYIVRARMEGTTLVELGEQLGLSRGRVRSLESRAYEKLRRSKALVDWKPIGRRSSDNEVSRR